MKKIFALLSLAFALFLNEKMFSQSSYSLEGKNLSKALAGSMQSGSAPIKIISFQGNINNDKISLQWTIDENETADRFELEKSSDGENFSIAALVFTSEKAGEENYMFYERPKKINTVYYRLKIYTKSQDINYSKVLRLSKTTALRQE
jgi:hypothetical protein